jgi:type II secretory pathway pseudopilin PulG
VRSTGRPRQHGGRGFTYLAVMFIVALLTLTAAMASAVWSTVQQRSDEHQLAFVGRQFQTAIERYAQRPADARGRYPRRLEDLLRDDRALQPVRHLRRIYLDPMTGRPEWGLIRAPDGGIVGVHSLSERQPMTGTLLASRFDTVQVKTYRDWQFIAAGTGSVQPAASAPAAARP